MSKSRYKVDLRALHAHCEANYARLLRLFPDYEACNHRRFAVGGTQVQMDVIERSRYTTLFRLQSFAPAAPSTATAVTAPAGTASAGSAAAGTADSAWPWIAPLRMEARAYHDAGMLEVVVFQGKDRTQGRYSYPNSAMHQQDEKAQQNAFLADWLAHCMRHGEIRLEGFSAPGAEHA